MRGSTRFSLSVKNQRAGTGRDGRTCLAKVNSQVRRGQGKLFFPCSDTTTSKIGNHTRLVHTLLKGMTIHTYITPQSGLQLQGNPVQYVDPPTVVDHFLLQVTKSANVCGSSLNSTH